MQTHIDSILQAKRLEQQNEIDTQGTRIFDVNHCYIDFTDLQLSLK
jgi:hypothetical protein